jgi:hypothetical protein
MYDIYIPVFICIEGLLAYGERHKRQEQSKDKGFLDMNVTIAR